jgi:RNA polymerase sigma factor (sigma-70 family)
MPEPEKPATDDWIHAALARFEGPLLRYALRWTGDLERARDVVQETFLRLCERGRCRLDGRVAEWLYTVCRNRAIEIGRKESRMSPVSDEEIERRECDQPAPGQAIEDEESSALVRRALAALPQREQEVILLKFQDGRSYREISAITGLSQANVGYLIHVGLRKIRRGLGVSPDGRRSHS